MKTKVLILDNYIKAYKKQKEAQEYLDAIKKEALEYLENEGSPLDYKNNHFCLVGKKKYMYSDLANEMVDAASKQKKIEELDGRAFVQSISTYIKMTTASHRESLRS